MPVLLNANRPLYEALCAEYTKNLPLFYQPFWLDAATGRPDAWLPLVHGEQQMLWPVYRKSAWPVQVVTMPAFTQRLGWWSPSGDCLPDIRHVIARLPLALYWQWHVEAEQAPLLRLNGFRITEGLTYVLPWSGDLEAVFKGFSELSRRNIRKAGRALEVQVHRDPGLLHRMIRLSYARHGIRFQLSEKRIAQMVNACIQHRCGEIYAAVDVRHQVHAVAWIAWDHQWSYFLAGGMDHHIPQIGASRLLLWHALQQAFSNGRSFDFHGGATPEIGQVYASLGGQPFTYRRARFFPIPGVEKALLWLKNRRNPGDRRFHTL